MAARSNTIYQDPRTVGSLSSALRVWRRVRPGCRDTAILHIIFTLSCWGESRATRVAGFLRRRRSCAVTRIYHVEGARRDTWHVHGSMYPALHSLGDLEATWTWLRRAAQSHQVSLLRVSLAQTAA